MPNNVLWHEQELADYILAFTERVIPLETAYEMIDRLEDASLAADTETHQNHLLSIAAQFTVHDPDTDRCPRCNSEMVQRTNTRTGEVFLGCCHFPKCKAVRKFH